VRSHPCGAMITYALSIRQSIHQYERN